MPAGYWTARFGCCLAARMDASTAHSGWHTYNDHGEAGLDHVAAAKGFFGAAVKNANRLADIDILVASPDKVARLLIEIEERPTPPKKLLGDVMAILLCNQVAVHAQSGQQTFKITPATRLVVAGIISPKGHAREKLSDVIAPRLEQFVRSEDGMSPENVEFVFRSEIRETLNDLWIVVAAVLELREPDSPPCPDDKAC
jgi:hypothetical protein